jgi:hypothetical protein
MVQRLYAVTSELMITITANHQYGITQIQDFVDINERLRSPVKNKARFKQLLQHLFCAPHRRPKI